MNQSDHILELARLRRVLRAADVREHGWSPQLLIRLHQAGKLQRFARGLYGLPDAEVTEHQTLIEVCQRVPKAVLCLLSALQFHEIGTQQPHEVWIALPEATQTPALSHPTLRMTRLRGTAYSEGIETVTGHGAPIRVYSAAKTVADCFKFRNKIGLDVALEALKDAWRSRKVTMAELSHFAKVNRVERVMQPYLEAVTQCPSDLGILALRLHPGDDLRGALEAGCRTAFVVAGLGSFSQAQLRFAGDSAPTLMHGPLELLSLTGSLTPVGAHLHASVSDAAGRVWGGHVCVGCIVRTTVELLVAPLPEGSLTREFDPATGYTELVVRRP